MTNPYDTLGIPTLAPLSVAKAAYRRLAQQYHPDRDSGDEEKFKAIKAAFEAIEAGWKPPEPEPTYTSSFTEPKQPKWRANEPPPQRPTAGKPAPGYEARGRPPPMPRARSVLHGTSNKGRSTEYEVDLTCSTQQAFEGCVIPFICDRTVIQYEVRPGAPLMRPINTERHTYPRDNMIGAPPGDMLTVTIHLHVLDEGETVPPPKENKKPMPAAPHNLTVKLCALGLFTGGKITVNDYLNVPVSITLEPGYDPSKPIIVPNRGYGSEERGDLRIRIEPVFKVPSALNQGERQQLARLNEMVK